MKNSITKLLYANVVLYHIKSFLTNKILNNVKINEILLNLIFQKAQMTSYEPLT